MWCPWTGTSPSDSSPHPQNNTYAHLCLRELAFQSWILRFQKRIHLLGSQSFLRIHKLSRNLPSIFCGTRHRNRLPNSCPLYQLHRFPCSAEDMKKQTAHLLMHKGQKACCWAAEMCKRSENTGKKPVARKGKQRLAWDAMVCTYTSEAAGVTNDGVGSSKRGDDQRRGYKWKCRQEKSNEGIGLQEHWDEIFLVSICILPITTCETGGIALIIRNVLFTLCVETHPNSAEPYALENK